MVSIAARAQQWPRGLRIALVAGLTAFVMGAGLFAYRYFSRPIVLTVAAGSADGEAVDLISAISARLTSSGAHVRFKVVDSGTALKAAEILAAGQSDLAIVRGDTGNLSDARTVLLLTHGVVLILMRPGSSADSVSDLRNVTIGVVGGEINRPVMTALGQVYQLDRFRIRFDDVAIEEMSAALSAGRIQALLVVVPLTGKYLAKVKAIFQQRAKGALPKPIAIDSAGAIANVAPAYESFDVPKGTLRGAPPVPSDDLTTLRVPFFLAARKSLNEDTVTDLTKALIDVRRDLLSEFPVLAQAAAPSTDADALIPIHPGAATYYNGEQQSFLDKYSDKLYYGFLMLGTLVSVVIAALRFAGFGAVPRSLLEPLYELGHEIKAANKESDLEAIEQKIDEMLKEELARSASGDNEDSDTAALNLAAQRLQYLMSLRRAMLHPGIVPEQKAKRPPNNRQTSAS